MGKYEKLTEEPAKKIDKVKTGRVAKSLLPKILKRKKVVVPLIALTPPSEDETTSERIARGNRIPLFNPYDWETLSPKDAGKVKRFEGHEGFRPHMSYWRII